MANDVKTLTATLDAMKVSLANVAADVKVLTAKIGTGMSQADVDAVQAEADAIAAGLADLAAQTPDEPA